MSRAVRIAARRLAACLTVVRKSVRNPYAPNGSGRAMAAWPHRTSLLMAHSCSGKLGGLLDTQLLPSSRYCGQKRQFFGAGAASFGLPAGVVL